MQVTRKTHRWPFVVALVGLFIFCLTVPRYWRATEKEKHTTTPRIAAQFGVATRVSAKRREATLDLADLVALDEAGDTESDVATSQRVTRDDEALLAELSSGILPVSPPPGFPTVSWPTPADVLAANERSTAEPTVDLLDEYEVDGPPGVSAKIVLETISGCESLGRLLAETSNRSITTSWFRTGMSVFGKWSASRNRVGLAPVTPIDVPNFALPREQSGSGWVAAGPSSGSTIDIGSPLLRLVTPDDRLAFAPAAEPQFEHLRAEPQPTVARELWSAPEVLLAQLEQLTHHPESQHWATDTLEQLRALVEGERRDRTQAAALLAGLNNSAADAIKLAQQTEDEALCVELLRAHWALERRLACWTAMRDIRLAAISRARVATRGALGPLLRDLPGQSPEERTLESLSADLETYERSRDPELGRRVAQIEHELRSSTNELDRALADAVEDNYRNANLRIAITGEMLSRYVSQEHAESQPVNDTIAGTPVRGESETVSHTRVELQPAVGRWQMELLTEGQVDSHTSNIGRAKAFTVGSTLFSASTPIVIDLDGKVHRQETSVSTTSCNQLVGVTTSVDWVPLIGGFARNRVVEEYQQKRPRAKAEVESKVAARTADRVEGRTDEMVAKVEQDVKERLTNPLGKYGIEITPLEMTTTNERVVARLRIAGGEQLAAHTPRPRALSDSLLSVQMHESALTNAAAALELNGERLSVSQLQARLREKLPRLALEQPPEARDDTMFQFASNDAVRFRINDGKLELVLSVADFRQENERVRNFAVHVVYKPVVNGLTAELVRDGGLSIDPGARQISASERALLYNVFKVVFSEDRRLPIFRPDDANDPRLKGLMITQMVLEDGWMGVSIGPESSGRVAERQRSLR